MHTARGGTDSGARASKASARVAKIYSYMSEESAVTSSQH